MYNHFIRITFPVRGKFSFTSFPFCSNLFLSLKDFCSTLACFVLRLIFPTPRYSTQQYCLSVNVILWRGPPSQHSVRLSSTQLPRKDCKSRVPIGIVFPFALKVLCPLLIFHYYRFTIHPRAGTTFPTFLRIFLALFLPLPSLSPLLSSSRSFPCVWKK